MDESSDPETVRALYVCSCALGLKDIMSKSTNEKIRDAYITQKPVRDLTSCDMYTSGSGAGGSSKEAMRVKQLLDSVEHGVGDDDTWFAGGKWYNEGILPYFSVDTVNRLTLYFPADASTVVDTSLMGLSTGGKDEMFKASSEAWNGAVVSFAFDGMTGSEFANNVKFTMPTWGSKTPTVELSELGVSDPLAISNTDVSDIY